MVKRTLLGRNKQGNAINMNMYNIFYIYYIIYNVHIYINIIFVVGVFIIMSIKKNVYNHSSSSRQDYEQIKIYHIHLQ